MNSLWQLWEAGLDSGAVDRIVSMCEQYPVTNPQLGFEGASSNDDYRRSEIRWVNAAQSPDIKNILWSYIEQANRNAFGFDVNYLNDIQFTTYHAATNDKYDWHVDTFWANPTRYDRKLSIIIQLSDQEEYVGCDFEFEPQYENPNNEALRKKGSVLVFPSFLSHRVTPVIGGTRKSLVAWAEGPSFR